MKHSPLHRSSQLNRTGQLRRRRKPVQRTPERDAWTTIRWGRCAVCGTIGYVCRHHCLYAQHIRSEGRSELMYDLRNALDIGVEETCACHMRHHWAIKRIPLEMIPDSALAFMVDVLGEEKAALYLARFYGCEETA